MKQASTYIQRRGNGCLETVDEFTTSKEARTMLAEYRISDPAAHYYASTRACKGWNK
jgi:RNase H-fold protein (predicted Holliday junction resolvase)